MNQTTERGLDPGLYIVATPIGNLSDLSPRAAMVLSQADLLAVEDSRVTGKLLNHLGVKRPMAPYHDHNADRVRPGLIARMGNEAIALVSDAGTPLISDPGFKLVRDAREAGVSIFTIPGPSAAIAALTLSGLPTNRFLFVGFLPNKAKARQDSLGEIRHLKATLIFYETGPRLAAALKAMSEVLGNREATISREITKLHEETLSGSLDDLVKQVEASAILKGEIVIVVAPAAAETSSLAGADPEPLLREALARLPVAKAAAEVAELTGLPKRDLYTLAVALKQAE